VTPITTDVAIVGGGAIGAACARSLAARGLGVTLLDPGPVPGAASPASAGLLAAQIEPGNSGWLALAVRARRRYLTLAPELLDRTGVSIGFARTGIATLAFTAQRAAALVEEVRRQQAAQERAEWLPPAEVSRRWPGIAPDCTGALHAPDDGSVNAPALTEALLADARRLGVRVVSEQVLGLEIRHGHAGRLRTERSIVSASNVVIAAGAWSATLPGLPRPLPVAPVRGQLLEAAWPAGVAPMAFYVDHAYVVCRDGLAIMGSTMEHVGFDAGITDSARESILAAARRLVPSLGAIRRQWSGLRPLTPDGLPILGADPEIRGLWYATGHGRNGILLAALTGDVVADLIASGSSDIDLAPLSVARFDRAPTPHIPHPTPL
jgi:glycine oxidase